MLFRKGGKQLFWKNPRLWTSKQAFCWIILLKRKSYRKCQEGKNVSGFLEEPDLLGKPLWRAFHVQRIIGCIACAPNIPISSWTFFRFHWNSWKFRPIVLEKYPPDIIFPFGPVGRLPTRSAVAFHHERAKANERLIQFLSRFTTSPVMYMFRFFNYGHQQGDAVADEHSELKPVSFADIIIVPKNLAQSPNFRDNWISVLHDRVG